jgi:hypothetical protein
MRRPDYRAPGTSGLRLPITWPLVLLFVAFPVWWVLGVSAFTWPVVAVPALVALILRGRTRAPVAMVLWFGFTSWVLLSGLQLESFTKITTFTYRLALYACAGVLFLYVYNLPRTGRLDTKVLRILTVFWIIVVIGGYAGILVGAHTFTPPVEDLLPLSLRHQAFVQELIQPVFAEVESFLGYPVPRPAAPFTYTNEWGGNIAVLTPVAFAAIATAGRGLRRKIIIVVLIASLVPMIVSLNRGMFLSLGGGIAYVVIRLAIRGRLGALVSLVGATSLIAVIVVLTPLGHLAAANLSSTHGHSNTTRLSVAQQSIDGANKSPVFGYGEPQQVTGEGGTPPIGSQGQLWMVLYSNGYPATVLFIAFFLAVLWQTRRARGITGLWLHTVPLIGLAQIAFYGWLPVELQVVMVAAALAYRRCGQPVRPGGGARSALTRASASPADAVSSRRPRALPVAAP